MVLKDFFGSTAQEAAMGPAHGVGLKKAGAIGSAGTRTSRHSSGWGQMNRYMREREGLSVLDVGATSSRNINFLTELGHSVYMANPLLDLSEGSWIADGADGPVFETTRFVDETLNFAGRQFDVVLLWDALDHLPEDAIQPVVDRLYASMLPGGKLLAFFHSKLNDPSASYTRFHLTDGEIVEGQVIAGHLPVRVLQNRAIERLFQAFESFKFLLAKDNLREVIINR